MMNHNANTTTTTITIVFVCGHRDRYDVRLGLLTDVEVQHFGLCPECEEADRRRSEKGDDEW